ncbi:MAG: MgtC/SapB family protein [Erysipelotrichaceae bacterium]
MKDPIAQLLGTWSIQLNIYSITLRVLLSLVLSSIIGWERASKRHSAGLRTFILMSLSATVIMIVEQYLQTPYYFMCAGSIIATSIICVHSLLVSSRSQIKGLTTACGLWAWTIISLALGAGLYSLSLLGFGLLLGSLSLFPPLEGYLKDRSNHFEIHLELKSSKHLENFVSTIRRLGMVIDDIEKNRAYSDSGLAVYSISLSIESKELKKYKTHKEIIEALSTLDYILHIEEIH